MSPADGSTSEAVRRSDGATFGVSRAVAYRVLHAGIVGRRFISSSAASQGLISPLASGPFIGRCFRVSGGTLAAVKISSLSGNRGRWAIVGQIIVGTWSTITWFICDPCTAIIDSCNGVNWVVIHAVALGSVITDPVVTYMATDDPAPSCRLSLTSVNARRGHLAFR